jgi:hypothetical protein
LGQTWVLLELANHRIQEAAGRVLRHLAAEVVDPGAQLDLALGRLAVHVTQLLADCLGRRLQGAAFVVGDAVDLEALRSGLGADRLEGLGDLALHLLAGLAQLGFVGLAGKGLGQGLAQLRDQRRHALGEAPPDATPGGRT